VFEGIDSRFLGPGCGNGNFLVAMLERKIIAINEAEHGGTDRVIDRGTDCRVRFEGTPCCK